jgi:glycosyltransferase involved in cell wall biosynthesis
MSANSKLITIIIATYNAGSTLEKCLESIASQTFQDFELLIVDGLSTDNTLAIINKYASSIDYWHSHKDMGIYDAWNQGLAKASGKYICFIGADDYFADDNALSRLASAINDQDYDLVSSQGKFLKSSGGHFIIGNNWNYNKIKKRITVCHPGLLHNRQLFERYGKFNTNYRIVSDYEFLLRLDAETKVKHISSVTVCISDGGISRSRYSDMLKEKRQVHALCPRIGKFKAAYYYYEKLVKIPIAKILRISY